MKILQTPPSWEKILASAGTFDRSIEIMHCASKEIADTDRYLHWEELRHRSGNSQFSAQEKWASLKSSRATKSQKIPLTDSKGRKFHFFLTQKMFQLLHQVDMQAGGGVSAPPEITTPDSRDRYYISSLIEEAITSSQLEGAIVTRSQAKDMLRTNRKPIDENEQMVLNNFLTMKKLRKLKNSDLTPELILEIHREISSGTLETPFDEGRFRNATDQVRIEDIESGEVFHTPPSAKGLPDRIQELCDFANDPAMTGYLHPVIRSIILHFWLAYEHPFIDGNGRTARALFYWSMLKHDFWLFEFISISQQILKAPKKYYRAFLYTETDDNDLNYFLLHQLQILNQSMESLHDYIAHKQAELESLRQTISPSLGFNHRQLALIRNAASNPRAIYTVVSHRTSHNIATQTARTDLQELEEKGLLKRQKISKAFQFSPTDDFTECLKNLSL